MGFRDVEGGANGAFRNEGADDAPFLFNIKTSDIHYI